MTCKTEIIVFDTVVLALRLKSMKSSNDKIENKERQSICLIKSMNISLQEKGLIFIKITYVDPYTVNDSFC